MKIVSRCKRLARRIIRGPEPKVVAIPQPTDARKLLEGKVALITGGSSGLGLAIGKAFLDSGCKVILAGRSMERLDAQLRELDQGDQAAALELDVNDVESLPEKARAAAALFPENRIDILVNSAGVLCHGSFLKVTPEEYDRVMDTNARGTFFMSQAVANLMIETNTRGHILNVSSSSALRPAWGPYQISKWGIRGMTLGMADKLLPYGITVNAIAPGPTATPMLHAQEGGNLYMKNQPSHRYALPSEIANLAVFMASGMGDLVVGDTFYITGGSGTVSLKY